MKRRSLTFRFIICTFLACTIIPPILMLVAGFAGYTSKYDVLLRGALSIPYKVLEKSSEDLSSPDLALRISQMVTTEKFVSNDFWIVDSNGKVVSSNTSTALPLSVSEMLFLAPGQMEVIWQRSNNSHQVLACRLKRDTNKFMVARTQYRGTTIEMFVNYIMGFAIVGSLVSATLVIGLLMLFLRFQSKQVHSVLEDLRAGKLESRFQVNRLDEVGQLMVTFNEMADEIEKLVIKLKLSENERTSMLQFLAHDIRTPLTSLRLITDEMNSKRKADTKSRRKTSALLDRELTLFEKYAEDLFFLARIRKPDAEINKTSVDLVDLVRSEVDRFNGLSKKVKFSATYEKGDYAIAGERALLQRLLQNLFSNSSRFAGKQVKIEVRKTDAFEIEIRDDGPGFTAESLESYGQRRALRYRVGAEKDSNVSLGLGSVIISQIAQRYGGEVKADNWTGKNGKIAGARVLVRIPFSVPRSQAA